MPHPSVPAAPSRQALAPGSLPLGKGTQAKSKQASHGICSLSSWTKCSVGRGLGTGEERQTVREEEKERQKGGKETEAETQRGERGTELETKRQEEGEKGRD